MKFLVTCLYILIVNLSLLVTFLCCQGSENYNDTVSVFLQKLDTLGGDKLQRIETALNSTIKDVRKILVEGDEVQRKSMTYDLTCALIELWVEITERTSSLERYKNEVLIPNYIANRFLCAWTLMLRVLDTTSQNEQLRFLSSRKTIFQLADTATKRNSTPLTKNRKLSKNEFIAAVQMLAPKLDHTIIQKVADHAVADYRFGGKRKIYYEKVLIYFTAWMYYLPNSGTRLQRKLMKELKLHYNDEELGAQIFALTIARDHFIANHVLQYFWEKFVIKGLKGCAENFEDVLDSEYIGGWYYVEESLKLFQLLVRALEQVVPVRRNVASEYQPLLKRPEIANRFLCAWTLMLRVLDVTSENEHLHFLSSRKKIFRLADTATKRNSTPLTKNRRLSKDEFIAVVQMLAPKLDHTIIQKVADHAVADYTFRGKRKNYYEKVLTYFTAWKTYLDYGRAERLRHKLMIELKLHYNDEELGAEIFALTISRDHFIANHVLQYFWEKFAIMMAKGIAGNFEDVLDSEYIGGWYYVEESLKLFQILVRAIKQIEPGRRNFATEYQPLLKRPEVGIPQSSACRAAIPMRNTSTSLSPK